MPQRKDNGGNDDSANGEVKMKSPRKVPRLQREKASKSESALSQKVSSRLKDHKCLQERSLESELPIYHARSNLCDTDNSFGNLSEDSLIKEKCNKKAEKPNLQHTSNTGGLMASIVYEKMSSLVWGRPDKENAAFEKKPFVENTYPPSSCLVEEDSSLYKNDLESDLEDVPQETPDTLEEWQMLPNFLDIRTSNSLQAFDRHSFQTMAQEITEFQSSFMKKFHNESPLSSCTQSTSRLQQKVLDYRSLIPEDSSGNSKRENTSLLNPYTDYNSKLLYESINGEYDMIRMRFGHIVSSDVSFDAPRSSRKPQLRVSTGVMGFVNRLRSQDLIGKAASNIKEHDMPKAQLSPLSDEKFDEALNKTRMIWSHEFETLFDIKV